MATYFVRKTGDDGNSGLTPAAAKLTLNAVEDLPVVPGDSVYIGAGTYRERLDLDVSGTALLPISYIGDYSGIYTGDAGVVRITGSDDDKVSTRNYGIYNNAKVFRNFNNLSTDLTVLASIIYVGDSSGTLENIYSGFSTQAGIQLTNPGTGAYLIKNCYFAEGNRNYLGGVYLYHSSTLDNRNISIQNCIFLSGYGFVSTKIGGATIKNSTFINASRGVQISAALTAGQTITVNNCLLCTHAGRAFDATAVGEITEDYNTIYGTITARTNTNTGAHSVTYPPLFDPRWFFEAVK